MVQRHLNIDAVTLQTQAIALQAQHVTLQTHTVATHAYDTVYCSYNLKVATQNLSRRHTDTHTHTSLNGEKTLPGHWFMCSHETQLMSKHDHKSKPEVTLT